jgi:hypothetical protein
VTFRASIEFTKQDNADAAAKWNGRFIL